MTSDYPFEAVALRLNALPTSEFVGARDAEVRSLRAAGDVDVAARVKALRRPSAAAVSSMPSCGTTRAWSPPTPATCRAR
ncbi:hypothetical protein [Aeromicrobium fastidiosum]|uniref:Uncharacterized protein n=1 Tax=Aeromicrobium fastidiosum TaxID=52699 RepID=A0A641ALE3_9ACTN|nr:hypothetical protein [Aeromicrobium fastidiosum]KAA1374786.1 hypothetical protein ESP62_015485 [Aeromicrobium fastidiosum]MBP2390663.1 hypothetical protein [Aeromicrobium fastidiosum]